jgi:hypothetical protein
LILAGVEEILHPAGLHVCVAKHHIEPPAMPALGRR